MKKIPFIIALMAMAGEIYAQDATVTLDYSVQRYLDNVSAFDRGKYINIHSSSSTDTDLNALLSEYDIGLGRQFWGPLQDNDCSSGDFDGDYSSLMLSDTNTSVKAIDTDNTMIYTTNTNSSKFSADIDPEEAAEYVVNWFNNSNDTKTTVPAYYEPFNEPFIHANEFSDNGYSDDDVVKALMAEIYAKIGEAIHNDQYLSNMGVIGYSDAYPSYELNDFSQWTNNMKMFMDNAGEYMDGFSTHLYDGINVVGESTLRSGSNSEAILDMVETYSYIKWGVVKPHAISEYGGITSLEDGQTKDYFYATSAYKVLPSINHIMFNLIEREDNMIVSIPFIGDKATWHLTESTNYTPYCSVIFMPDDPTNASGTTWYRNDKEKFYMLWKGVSGDRVQIQSDNLDVQTLAFRSGNTLYIALDNLETDIEQTVNVSNFTGWGSVTAVTERAFSVDLDSTGDVSYEEISHGASMPETVTLAKSGTTVLVVSLNDTTGITNTITRKKYYSNTYLQSITANRAMNFGFTGVETGSGYGRAIARISLGKSKTSSTAGYTLEKPIVTINGTEITFPDNWRGYNQAGRSDFFGTFEVEFDISLLQSGSNTVEVTYDSTGGYISSVVLQVETYATQPSTYSTSIQNGNFESTDMSYWTPFSPLGNISIETSAPLSGSRSLKIEGKAGVFQNVALEDKEYKLGATVMSDKSGTVILKMEGNKGEIKSETFTTSTSTDAFYLRNIEFTDGSTTATVSVYSTNSDQTMLIDDVSLSAN